MSYRDIEVPDEVIDDLRIYIGDKPVHNRLEEGTELSDEKIRLAVRLFVDHFNNHPPPLATKYTVRDFPDSHLMFQGTMIEMMKMAGILKSRNHLNFQDSGAAFTVNDKGQDYMNWIQTFMQSFQRNMEQVKSSLNAEEGFDQIQSPEAWYPDFW